MEHFSGGYMSFYYTWGKGSRVHHLIFLGFPPKYKKVILEGDSHSTDVQHKSFSNLAGNQNLWLCIYLSAMFFYLFIFSYRFLKSWRNSRMITSVVRQSWICTRSGIYTGVMFWGDSDLQSVFGFTAFVEDSAVCGFLL